MDRLSGPLPARVPETGPSAPDCAGEQPSTAYPPAPPRALGERLSPAERTELITAFNAGVTQETLAAEHGISIRWVKRLVHGTSNRPQAAANRLTPDQRDDLARGYRSAGISQNELAHKYGVNLSTVKRILRNHVTDG